jgi:hypothetical protein
MTDLLFESEGGTPPEVISPISYLCHLEFHKKRRWINAESPPSYIDTNRNNIEAFKIL